MKTVPSTFTQTKVVMSNYDHTIEEWAKEKLMTEEVHGQYAGWDFCGDVWFCRDVKKFCCEVWRHHIHVNTVEEDSLEQLMASVSSMYGPN